MQDRTDALPPPADTPPKRRPQSPGDRAHERAAERQRRQDEHRAACLEQVRAAMPEPSEEQLRLLRPIFRPSPR